VPKRPGVEHLRTDYLTSLRRRDLAPGTIQHRRNILLRLTQWMAPRTILDATTDDLERFLDRRPIGSRTRYCYISHLSAFYDWCVLQDLIATDPTTRIERPKLRQTLPRPISDGDLIVALQAPDHMMATWFHLAAYNGLRCAEIATLEGPDIDPSSMTLRVVGKGRKDRIVPMHPKVLMALQSWGIPRTGPVFRRPCGAHINGRRVSQQSSAYLAGLGINATMHQLRHWFGTKALEACGNLRAVQELLGHSSPATTAIYTKVAVTRLRSVVDALECVGTRETATV